MTESLIYSGINTTSLLVRLAGKVKGVVSSQELVYVDDGFGFEDGVGPVLGMQVHVPSGVSLPSKNRFVIVTGISRVKQITLTYWGEVNGDYWPPGTVLYVPGIWFRDANDIRVL